MAIQHTLYINPDESATRFIEEWNNKTSYVFAHTSGSTGTPKEVMLHKDDMRSSAKATNRYFGIKRGDLLRCPLSCNYIAGKMMVVRADCAEAIIDFSHDLTIDNESHIKLMSVVPAQIRHLIDLNVSLKTIENLLIGGAPLSESLEQELMALRVNAYVSYGMTETCSHVAVRHIGERFYHAMPGIEFTTDSTNRLIINVPYISSAQVITNDIVNLHDNQTFEWIGRFDNVVNTGGVKVFPEIIENKIRGIIPAGITYYISSRVHRRWGEEVILVCDNDPGITPADFVELPVAERPHAIMIDEIERTSSGKIKRRRY